MTLAYLAGAWLLGTAAAAGSVDVWPLGTAIALAGLLVAERQRRARYLLLGLAAAALFVGAGYRYDGARSDTTPGIAAYNDGAPVRFRALVDGEPEIRGSTQRLRLSAREVFDGGAWHEIAGGVQMRAARFPEHRYGDVLEVAGELETPPVLPDFDYRDYLAQRGIGSLIAYAETETIVTGEGNRALAALYDTRAELGDALERALPEPQGALAQGILLGRRSAIPPDLVADMNATGTSHLIAISGQNVSLVAGFVIALFAWLIGRRQAAIVALVAIAAYTALTGASPSVVRAAIMGGLFVVATLLGRPASASTSITLAAAGMAAWHPGVVLDVSFQLSFASILGLVYLSPGLQERGAALLRRVAAGPGGVGAFLLESGAVTLGATLATLPLIAMHFGRVSLVALPANVLAVPAFPLILASSAVTAVLGEVWPPLGEAAGWGAWAALTYLIETARALADLPLASVQIDGFGKAHAALAYAALAGLAWRLARPRRPALDRLEELVGRSISIRPAWALAGALTIGCALVWFAALAPESDGRLSVTVLDVGQGDALLIETPEGHRVLIDGGPSGAALARELSEELAFWDRRIDLIVLTHPQRDHLTGLVEALDRYDVRALLSPPVTQDSALYREWRTRLADVEATERVATVGDRIDLGGGAELAVLGPGPGALASGEPNDASLVLRVTYGAVSFLLTGDIEAQAETALVASDGAALGSTVLKLAHHGSQTSTTASFLAAVRPELAVVSVGTDNAFGHPAPPVLARLDEVPLLRTDRDGRVRFETDGTRLWVETER